jgi:hypothetical protein
MSKKQGLFAEMMKRPQYVFTPLGGNDTEDDYDRIMSEDSYTNKWIYVCAAVGIAVSIFLVYRGCND